MTRRTDEELAAVLGGPADDWEPAAIVAAQNEAMRRGISLDKQEELVVEGRAIAERASVPLAKGWRALAMLGGVMLFGGIVILIFNRILAAEGRVREAKELVSWWAYGVGAFLGGSLLLALVSGP